MSDPKQPATASRPRSSRRPLFERVQDLSFKMDAETGTSLFRIGMFSLLVLFVVLLYTGTQFYGLREGEAMDMGQIARNLSRGRGYSTQVIRPLEVWHLNRLNKPAMNPATNTQPELFTPPVYPAVLSLVFRLIKPDTSISAGGRTVKADRLMMLVSWGFYLLGLILLYFLAREMFDHRVGVMSLFLYVFCDPLLDAATSGRHHNFLAMLFMIAALAVIKAEKWHADGRSARWPAGALIVSSLAIAFGTLTDYAFIATLLPLLLYVGISFPAQWKRWVVLCLMVFGMVCLPWMARNMKVARRPFGLNYITLYENTGTGTDHEIHEGDLQRTYAMGEVRLQARTILREAFLNIEVLYQKTLKDVGANYLIMFFLVSLMHRWRDPMVYRLRRFIFWSLLCSLAWLSITGPPERNFLMVFLPLIIVYGTAFFYVMFERLQFRTRFLRYGMIGGFAVLNCIVFAYKILPPRTTVPYPPYDGGVAGIIGRFFAEDALLASDLPRALAWYGDRATVYMPRTQEEYIVLNDGLKFISAIYLTQATTDRIKMGDLASAMIAKKPLPWMQTFPLQTPPPNFPLRNIQVLPTRDQKQYLLTNVGM